MNEKTDQPKEQEHQIILAIFKIHNKQGVEARHQLKFTDVDSIREIYSSVNAFIKTISKENPFQLLTLTIVPQSITGVEK